MLSAFTRILREILTVVLVVVLLVWAFGPREPVDTDMSFAPGRIGPDVDAYLQGREAAFVDIVPGNEKQVVWAGEPGARTPFSVIYIHGFSAGPQEIRPTPDLVAQSLNANLYFTRLTGHGRDEHAMAEATVGDWMQDMAEALAIGRRIGERVVIISTSTGGTISAVAAHLGETQDVAGIVFISPNFRVNSIMAGLLTWPAVRWWGPVIAGQERCFTPKSDLQARYWTECYPLVATLPMAAIALYARELDYSEVMVPSLWIYVPDDRVVDADVTDSIHAQWGGAVEHVTPELKEGADEHRHVIAGDVVSPSMTEEVAKIILDWATDL